MALVLTPIYTRTITSSTSGAITFNNVPQFYTDLMIKISARGTGNYAERFDTFTVNFNGDYSSSYSRIGFFVSQSGNTAQVYSNEAAAYCGIYPNALTTADTLGSTEIYIANYRSSNFKQITTDAVGEQNASPGLLSMYANLYRKTDAIQTITVGGTSNFTQHSTFSLYGIIRSGA